MPELSKQLQKIISISLFAVIVIIKSVCFIIIMGLMDTPCIAGWHVNQELAYNLLLLTIGFIPDILMLLCIGAGMLFKDSNIGADPRTIIYNFSLGFLCIGAFVPFIGLTDCRSENFSTIKLLGVLALVAGVFHIANAVACLLYLAKEEKQSPPSEQRRLLAAAGPSTSRGSKSPPSKAKAAGKGTPKGSPKTSPKAAGKAGAKGSPPKKPCPKKKK